MLLTGLTDWIGRVADDLEVVIAVPSWPELLTHENFPVDLVLLDLDLKDNLPISLKISTLKTMAVKTIVISTYSNPDIIREALAAGASGYLLKSENAEVIVSAIRSTLKGGSYISTEILEILEQDPEPQVKLSEQERKVIALFVSGEPLKSVSAELGITEETAKSYLKRAREKYRAAGIDVGTKLSLRDQAVKDGIVLN